MADESADVHGRYIPARSAELVVGLLFVLGGLVVIADSLRVGIAWGDDGPKAGYFPFYIGCLLMFAGGFVAVQAVLRWKSLAGNVFVTWARLRPVLTVLLPTIGYVALIALTGIYVASAIYITGFMIWQGKFRVLPALAAGLGVPLVIFLLFEVWFLIPLPKGPLEHLFGY